MSTRREETTSLLGLSVGDQYHASLDGGWMLDADGLTTEVGPTAAALLGYAPEALRGRPVSDFVDPDHRDTLLQALERRREGVQESYELLWRSSDGAPVWILLVATPLHDAGGRYVGSFALLTDVTARRRAEDRARRQAREQAAVSELGRLALQGGDLGALFDAAARAAAEVLDVDLGVVYALGDGGHLTLRALHGLPAGSARDIRELRLEGRPRPERSPTEPRIVTDWHAPDAPPLPPTVRALGVRASVAVPITGRRRLGLLAVAQRRPWTPDDDELCFLQALSHVVAGAMERAAGEGEARRNALHDQLTGLPNRTLALDRTEQALARAHKMPHTVAAVLVELDRFKRVNDELGVEAGDEVLRSVASRMREAAGPFDTVARLGGDAFVVLCDQVTEDARAVDVALRVVEAVRRPLPVRGEELVVTVSAGVAIARGGEGAGALLRDAEVAMDRAKALGRDRYEVFEQGLRERSARRVRLRRDLRGALSRGELFVVHQPIVALRSGRAAGVEALVRWRHPELGMVGPEEFVPLAEEAGLIGKIGMWVLRAACRDVARRQGTQRLSCHVNVSPRQAADPALPALVEEALMLSGLPPERLVLELTESSLMEAGESPLEILSGVRDLGVRIVLDDFGTGYSSLARLRHFPIDGLKIDRSFVAALESGNVRDALLVAGILDLARTLGLTVVAEGVETPAQLERLRSAGCGYAQGFLLACPAEGDALDTLLGDAVLLPAGR